MTGPLRLRSRVVRVRRLGLGIGLGLGGWMLAVLAGCGGHGDNAGSKPATAEASGAGPNTGVLAAVKVTVAPVEHRSVMRTVDVVGTLHGWEDVTIGAKRDGRVVKVFHDMGDRVEPGELLVQLETEAADLAIVQAERQLQAELAKIGL